MQKIKPILLIISFLVFSINSYSSELLDRPKLIFDIQNQVEEIENHIDELGKNNIAAPFFSKLKEFHYALSQLKAETIESKQNLEEIITISTAIERILNLKNHTQQYDSPMPKKATGNSTIRGVISSAETGNPVADHWVRLYDANGIYLESNYTDTQGRYIFSNLIAGQYTAIVIANLNEFIDTAQPNITCAGGLGLGCLINDLPLITLEVDQILEQVNISILSTPTISGKVRNTSNNNISYSEISIYNESGILISTSSADYYGEFTIGLPQSGNYYIGAAHSSYLNQLYNNLNCETNCDFNLATLLEVSDNEQIENFDFYLNYHASINGTLVDADTQAPITSGSVNLYNTNNQLVNSTSLNSNNQ